MRLIKLKLSIILIFAVLAAGCAGGLTSIDNKKEYKQFSRQMISMSASIDALSPDKEVSRLLKEINVKISRLKLKPKELNQAFDAILTDDRQALRALGRNRLVRLKILKKKIVNLTTLPKTIVKQGGNLLTQLNKRKEKLLKLVLSIEGKAQVASRAPILSAQKKSVIKRRAVKTRALLKDMIKQISDMPKRLASMGPKIASEVRKAVSSLKRLGLDAFAIAKKIFQNPFE